MRCPACRSILYRIQPGEYVCHNTDCPERDPHQPMVNVEWYGYTQRDINEMYEQTRRVRDK